MIRSYTVRQIVSTVASRIVGTMTPIFRGGRMSDRPGRLMTPMLLVIIGVLLIVGAIIVLFLPRGANPAPTDEIPFPEVERVRLDEAKAAFDAGSAVFVDVRSSDQFAASHIPGALSIPLAELEDRLAELDPGAWIIPY
jgi:hypothetical protein